MVQNSTAVSGDFIKYLLNADNFVDDAAALTDREQASFRIACLIAPPLDLSTDYG